MFNIRNCRDLYLKLVAEYEDLLKDPTSARIAINFALTAYHMAEWIWGEWLENDTVARDKLGINAKEELKGWVCLHHPLLADMRSIANGSKHFKKDKFGMTAVGNNYVAPGYAEPGYFESTCLLIDTGRGPNPSWTDLRSVAEQVVAFWRDFLHEHSQYKDLPVPPPSRV